jgi:hypothetical protein
MKRYIVMSLVISSLVISVLMLSSCSAKVQETPEGIPKKVVIGDKGGANLYDSKDLRNHSKKAKQWDTFFVVGIQENYYEVTSDLNDLSHNLFIKKTEYTIPWNTYLALGAKNSPHNANPKRQPTRYWKTLESLQLKQDSGVLLIEKPKHSGKVHPSGNHDPIMRDHGNNVYQIAALHDKGLVPQHGV